MAYGIIYKATCSVSGKSYIGQTTTGLESRWKKHQRPTSRCLVLQAAIQKYGAYSFTLKEICEAETKDELDRLEEHWIRKEGTLAPHGYNLQAEASGGWGSEESIERLRESALKRVGGWAKNGRAKGPSSLDEADVRKIFRLADEGTPQKDIAKLFKVSPSTVSHILRGTTWSHLGLARRSPRPNLEPHVVETILTQYYDQGLESSQIQEAHHLNKGQVDKIIRGASYPDIFHRVANGRSPRKPDVVRMKLEAKRLRSEGVTYEKVGQALGVSTGYAWKLCR